MNNETCKATTALGERCRIKAGASGFCFKHDPEKIQQRVETRKAIASTDQNQQEKGAKLREVISLVEQTCRAKGWYPYTTHIDKTNWQYASIHVDKQFRSNEVEGNFDITVNDGVKISGQTTSFYSYGFKDLHASIMQDLLKLTWVEKPKPAQQITSPDPIPQILRLLRRFHGVARQLARRHDNRPTLTIADEYDVQDLLHALLKTNFDDVREEEVVPSYAGKSSRTDFLLKKEKIFIEVKITRANLRDKDIGEQLIIDIQRYQAHPDCQTLICFVYDPLGFLKNPAALEHDLSKKHNDIIVKVIVVSI